jgi:putative sigma-54 modulation protein
MIITYTGRHEDFPPKQREKLEAKLRKISKLLDRRGDKEAHVIVSKERFLHKVEITINAHDHALVGIGADADLFTAMCTATEKIEKQVVKMRTKWRDTHRHAVTKEAKVESATAPAPSEAKGKSGKVASGKAAQSARNAKTNSAARVFRVDHNDGKKPMTLEEAMLEMGEAQDYLVYRDAKTDKVAVLMRRPDGHLDLIES